MRQARKNAAPEEVDSKFFVTPIPMPRAKSLARSALQTAAKLYAAISCKVRASDLVSEFPIWFAEHGTEIARLDATAEVSPTLDEDGILQDFVM